MQAAIQRSAETALPDLAAVARLAAAIAGELKLGDVVALSGEVGAGKTTLARAILEALGHSGEVPSPTFTLIQSYELPGLAVAHIDLYRLRHDSELAELGLDDALASGAALLEWPEMAEGHLPEDVLKVQLLTEPRRARMAGHGRWKDKVGSLVRAA